MNRLIIISLLLLGFTCSGQTQKPKLDYHFKQYNIVIDTFKLKKTKQETNFSCVKSDSILWLVNFKRTQENYELERKIRLVNVIGL